MILHRAHVFRSLAAACLALGLAATAAPAQETIYHQLRQAAPDAGAIPVEEFVLERDVHTFTFHSGAFYLLTPVEGRTFGAVFVGDGSFELDPATERERHHLAVLTGRTELQVFRDGFKSMLLLFSDDTAEELQAARSGTAPVDLDVPKGVLQKYLKAERKQFHTNFHVRLLADLVNEGMEHSLFLAIFDGDHNPDTLVAIDPYGVDALRMHGEFEMGSEESMFYVAGADTGGTQNRGALYLSHLASELEGGKRPAHDELRLTDGLHYEIETRVRRNTDIDGRTTLRLKPLFPGLRFVPVNIAPELRIQNAVMETADGEVALQVIQEHEDEDPTAALVSPQPLPEGSEVTIRIDYSGEGVLDDSGEGNYTVGARHNWYPNVGVFTDRATFDLTFHVPLKNEVVSVGEHVHTGEAEDHVVSVWKASTPIAVAGFNYGRFKVFEQEDESTGKVVKVFTNPGTPDIIHEINSFLAEGGGSLPTAWSSGPTQRVSVNTGMLAEAAMADGINTIRVLSHAFGPIPLKQVSITQQTQLTFGQAWPGLIYLPYVSFLDGTTRQMIPGLENMQSFVDRVGIHEMAHQWWGHHVGNASYRDVWISEGFAEFSTALVIQQVEGWDVHDKYWDRMEKLILESGRSKVGPVSQGTRLIGASRAGAYQTTVYFKGAFVLHMLRMMMHDQKQSDPDAEFFAMMTDFAKTYGGRTATTDQFKEVVERHLTPGMNATGDGKMDWFFDQWVHGVEIPKLKSDLQAQRAGGRNYRITGTVEQSDVSPTFITAVPIYIDLGKGQVGMLGRARFRGPMKQSVDVTLELPKKPKAVRINLHHDVLARN